MCVALCAALAQPYHAFFCGSVLREMCIVMHAPPDLAPSINQWKSLVEVCEGALNRSHFPATYEHFYRLLAPGRQLNRERRDGAATLAKALLTLAEVSTGKLVNATFIGNKECAFLAAAAQCLLRLSIEIRDEENSVLYRNYEGQISQVTFIRAADGVTQSRRSTILVASTCQFVSLQSLLHKLEELEAHDFHTPTTWEHFFEDAFVTWEAFRKPKAAFSLMKLIGATMEYVRQLELYGQSLIGIIVSVSMRYKL